MPYLKEVKLSFWKPLARFLHHIKLTSFGSLRIIGLYFWESRGRSYGDSCLEIIIYMKSYFF